MIDRYQSGDHSERIGTTVVSLVFLRCFTEIVFGTGEQLYIH